MKVLSTYTVKGEGTIIVVDNCPPEVRLGDVVTNGTREWIIIGADSVIPPKSHHYETGLALKEVGGGALIQAYPDEGEELTVKKLPLMEREVGRCTLGELVEVLGRASKEQQDLAVVLKDLVKAIMHLEMNINSKHQNVRMKAIKDVRETFNRIPPKWLHQ